MPEVINLKELIEHAKKLEIEVQSWTDRKRRLCYAQDAVMPPVETQGEETPAPPEPPESSSS